VEAGHEVIGAYSIEPEYKVDNVFTKTIYLPHIKEDTFKSEFQSLIKQFDGFWTSISAVYRVTMPIIEKENVNILSTHPADQANLADSIISNEMKIREAYLSILDASFSTTKMKIEIIGSIIKDTLKVPGQSHLDKLVSICSIFSSVPKNTDIVEIGSLWGRTAKLFNTLSQLYKTGNLLCIDPWPKGNMTQNTHEVLDSYSRVFDGDKYFSIFCNNLMACGQNKISYIRDISDKAINTYLNGQEQLCTDEFGCTPLTKKIGLLHVDGNHKYEDVVNDINNYASLVVNGGWIVFDDYNWPYGDGVTIAADEFLIKSRENISSAFYSGGALFVQLK
jgi:hypothetical protein